MRTVVAYLAVALGATVPWFELFVVPPAILGGLSPVPIGIIAALANAAGTVAVVLGWERLAAWYERRRGRPLAVGSRRGERARRAFERYGVPGLALQGPVVTGIYLAAVIALGLGADRRQVLGWSLVSIAAWSGVLVTLTVAGVRLA